MIWFADPSLTAFRVRNIVGFIPTFLDEDDLRPVRAQINERYAHGGGWQPSRGWTLLSDGSILYEGDSPLSPVAWTHLRHETIIIYHHAWVAIIDPDGTFEVARCD